ncbi:MAG: DUF1499 domain-containing protein [Alphaproteobacteria bacterium]|nr:DUF1499 domain-containing protein [Alphaproteobacteria bacterium]
MARIFFKKDGQKPSVFASLGLTTACIALLALVAAGPVVQTGVFGNPNSAEIYDLQLKLIWVAFRLVIVAAVFTATGVIHGRLSSRARTSWRALAAALMTVSVGWPSGQILYDLRYGPTLHDISTRPTALLNFTNLPERQYDSASPLDILGSRHEEQYLAKLMAAYPGLGSIPLAGTVEESTNTAMEEMRRLGWNIVFGDTASGHIEAIHTSLWFGFRSFILVKVRAIDAVSFLDIRTVSEMGHTDRGTGIKLIGKLRSGLNQSG